MTLMPEFRPTPLRMSFLAELTLSAAILRKAAVALIGQLALPLLDRPGDEPVEVDAAGDVFVVVVEEGSLRRRAARESGSR